MRPSWSRRHGRPEALAALGADGVAVEDLLLRVGLLADDVPELHHARLNPVLVSPAGTWVLQAELRVAPLPSLPVDPVRSLG